MLPRPGFLLLRIRIDPNKSLRLKVGDVLFAGILLSVFEAVNGLVLLEVGLVLDAAEEVEVG